MYRAPRARGRPGCRSPRRSARRSGGRRWTLVDTLARYPGFAMAGSRWRSNPGVARGLRRSTRRFSAKCQESTPHFPSLPLNGPSPARGGVETDGGRARSALEGLDPDVSGGLPPFGGRGPGRVFGGGEPRPRAGRDVSRPAAGSRAPDGSRRHRDDARGGGASPARRDRAALPADDSAAALALQPASRPAARLAGAHDRALSARRTGGGGGRDPSGSLRRPRALPLLVPELRSLAGACRAVPRETGAARLGIRGEDASRGRRAPSPSEGLLRADRRSTALERL